MISTTPIRTPKNPAPTCRCGECIADPMTSHGIYMIGAYRVPAVLSLRGGRVTEPEIAWESVSTITRGKVTKIFPFAQADDDRRWLI